MDINAMIKEYTDWLNHGFTVSKVGEYVELTTPFLDRNHDHLQIYVRRNSDGTYFLTDDGYVLGNLKSSGVSISRSTIEQIIRGFGITLNGDSLQIVAQPQDYAQKKHLLLQTMLTINSMA